MGRIVDISAMPEMDLGGRDVLVACAMVEDEVACAVARADDDVFAMWVGRGFHSEPSRLRRELQRRIDWADEHGAGRILLAFGLCGNGAVGLRARHAQLAMPRFDDCVNFMLAHGPRTKRGYAQAGVMYLTRGWTHDDAAMVTELIDGYVLKYGPKRAKRLMDAMYGAYRAVSLIDNGCYDLDEVADKARRSADALGVGLRVEEGSNEVLEKLVCGPWDDDILACGPGRAIAQEDFEFETRSRK